MKFTRHVASISNLEAVVIHDLRDIGVKIPKIRKQSEQQIHSTVPNERCGIFGYHLYQLPCCVIENYGAVPKFLMEIIDLIEKDIDVEGIFRRSGSVAKLKELRVKIDAGESVTEAGVLDFAGLLKQFLRDLPEPLLTSQLQDVFLSCYDLTPASKRVAAVLLLCHLLPQHNLSALRYICTFLHRVVDRSVHNKMDAANVAICLAPNIFHASSASAAVVVSDATKSMLSGQAGVVELLIDHASEIGVIGDDLHERVTMMTECFSDTVLDDCELETTECREKKRSGSFQGLVSNLSNSFTKWRSRDKHNASAVSSSCAEAIARDCDSTVNKESLMLDRHTVAGLTPRLRKRKAEDEAVPFSAKKKKDILNKLPQMSALASTPYTPTSFGRKGRLVDADSNINSPSVITASNDDDLEATYDCESSQHSSSGTKIRRGNSLDSSPNYTAHVSKSKVRRSFEGLIRRLSGGRDNPKVSSKQEVLRDGLKPQRSPSAPSFGSPLCEHNQRVMGQFDVSEDAYQNKRGTSRRQRSLSADGASIANTSLRRGRPNTINSGLPSPANRQMSDPVGYGITMGSLTSIDQDDDRLATAVIDTSPIAGNGYVKQDCEDSVHQLIHQVSKDSIGSFAVDEGTENALDQAFIGSVLDTDLMTASVDLDVTGSSASTADDHSVSVCSASSDTDLVIIGHTPMGQQRPVDLMERYIMLPDRTPSRALSGCNSLSVPKIKPSLMPTTVTSRLLGKANCPSRVCGDSPVSSGRLSARSMFTDPQN